MDCIEILKNGGIAVIATDTIYGIVALAENETAVTRVYEVKGRAPEKPCIILLSSIEELAVFGATPTEAQRIALEASWPGPVTFILPCNDFVPAYLHRGTHTLAFRLPEDDALLAILRETGPLIAPSANPQGEEPATTVAEARAYFGEDVDCYRDSGRREGKPSRLIALSPDGTESVLRP